MTSTSHDTLLHQLALLRDLEAEVHAMRTAIAPYPGLPTPPVVPAWVARWQQQAGEEVLDTTQKESAC